MILIFTWKFLFHFIDYYFFLAISSTITYEIYFKFPKIHFYFLQLQISFLVKLFVHFIKNIFILVTKLFQYILKLIFFLLWVIDLHRNHLIKIIKAIIQSHYFDFKVFLFFDVVAKSFCLYLVRMPIIFNFCFIH